MLYSGHFVIKETLEIIAKHIEFRNNRTIRMSNPKFLKILQDGLIYIHGCDKDYRPIIILNAHLLDLKKNDLDTLVGAISYFLINIKKYTMIPYHVENWVFLLETNKMGIFDYPINALGAIIS